jgi:hypothetical protein
MNILERNYLQPQIPYSILGPKIVLNILFSDTLKLTYVLPSFSQDRQESDTHTKQQTKFIFHAGILIYTFLDRSRKDKTFWTEW